MKPFLLTCCFTGVDARAHASNSAAPICEPSFAPGGNARIALPTCVVNWFTMSNFASFALIGMKPVRGSD